jgi:hypothetical protein
MKARKPLPSHPEGWKYKGGCGEFRVWHAGPNDYRITRGENPAVIAQDTQFSLAYHRAVRLREQA